MSSPRKIQHRRWFLKSLGVTLGMAAVPMRWARAQFQVPGVLQKKKSYMDTLWSWGFANYGLGRGSQSSQLQPAMVLRYKTWSAGAPGYYHCLYIDTEGQLWSSGVASNGRLGNGTTTTQLIPLIVGGDTDWVAATVGRDVSLALKSTGTLWSWGDGVEGALGSGAIADISAPTQVGGDTDWVQVSSGDHHVAALKSTGTLWSWGDNIFGQLGQGDYASRSSPTQIGVLSTWVSVSCGNESVIARRSDGTLWSWGSNRSGRIGQLRTSDDPVSPDTDWDIISVGNDFVQATKTTNNRWAWGRNDTYRYYLGDGTSVEDPFPKQKDSFLWAELAAGSEHSMGVRTDGSLWGWGHNNVNQLGNGTTSTTTSPVQSGTDTDWSKVSAGSNHSLGLKSDNSLWSWGFNLYGQLGQMKGSEDLFSNGNFQAVSVGPSHVMSIKTDGTLWGWGQSHWDRIGYGGPSTRLKSPVQVGVGTNWTIVDAGSSHGAGLQADSSLWVWGLGSDGQLGDGVTGYGHTSSIPKTLAGTWLDCAAGTNTTYGIKADGSLWAWGSDSYGRLGLGSIGHQSEPTQIGLATDWAKVISNKYYNGFALKADGSLWSWGISGNQGGLVVTSDVPAAVGSDTDWVKVAGSYRHTMAIKANGQLWGWGDNSDGRVGDGTTTSRSLPVQVGVASNWIDVACGISFTLALSNDGRLWGWGDPSGNGGFGDLTTTILLTPQLVSTDTDWASVSAQGYGVAVLKTDGSVWAWGESDVEGSKTDEPSQIGLMTWTNIQASSSYSLGIQADGSLWAWGYNAYGQLGNENTSASRAPQKIGAATDWAFLSTGDAFVLATKSGGTLWTWGQNAYGQLGDGTTVHKSSPIQIGSDTNWSTTACGSHTSLAIKTDGTLWGWGDGSSSGVLGDGVLGSRSSPVQIGTDTDWDSIFAHRKNVVAKKTDGSIRTWGGYLTEGSGYPSPKQMGVDSNWSDVAAGLSHSLALKSDGSLWGWGNGSGIGASGVSIYSDYYSPVQVGADTDWQKIAAGTGGQALKTDDTLWVWGSNGYYVGSGNNSTSPSYTPTKIWGKWKKIFTKGSAIFAIRK